MKAKAFYEKNKELINDLFHIIIGIAVMYDIGILTNFYTYTLMGKIIGVTGASIILGSLFGVTWESLKEKYKKSKFNKKDVIRGVIGFTIGGFASAWIFPSQTLAIVLSIITVGILTFNFTYKK